MTTERINELSREEIAERIAKAELEKKPRERPCLLCGKVVHMRGTQTFCSSNCRVTYHRKAVDVTLALAWADNERLKKVEAELLREIFNLSEENKSLRALLTKE